MMVTVQYANPPRPGGKYGNLKLVNGQTIYVPPDLVQYFQSGSTYDIVTKEETWGQGSPDAKTVTVCRMPPRVAQAMAGNMQAHTGQRRTAPGFQPRVVQGGPPARTGDEARQIFVTGVVGRAMGSGKFAASEIPVLTQAAMEAFDRLSMPKPPPLPPLLPNDPPFDDIAPPPNPDDIPGG